jgi:hypothetical protein
MRIGVNGGQFLIKRFLHGGLPGAGSTRMFPESGVSLSAGNRSILISGSRPRQKQKEAPPGSGRAS